MKGYILLLAAFFLTFYIRVVLIDSFDIDYAELLSGFFHLLLNATAMFAGEIDTFNLSFDTVTYTNQVMFFLFVCLVAIILLNMFNGLAVRDTEQIRKNAEIPSLEARLKFVLKI
jgi:hypothetical protein